jgi:hypothetical protein
VSAPTVVVPLLTEYCSVPAVIVLAHDVPATLVAVLTTCKYPGPFPVFVTVKVSTTVAPGAYIFPPVPLTVMLGTFCTVTMSVLEVVA